MIEIARSSDPAVRAYLSGHPRVMAVETGAHPGIEFYSGSRTREVRVGDADAEIYGLVELMDNNPLVCAEVASVPSAAATLALIALGPPASVGLIFESPALVINVPGDEADVDPFLATAGWAGGVNLHIEPQDLRGVGAAAVIAAIPTPGTPADLDLLYEERFGRSFFVRRNENSPWDPELVANSPSALYRLTLAVDQPYSLLTVRVLGDLNGKLGAAQVIHCMNVMCGFEESLGIA